MAINDIRNILTNQKVSKRVSPLRGQRQDAPREWMPEQDVPKQGTFKFPKVLRNALLAIAGAGVIGAAVARTNLDMENHAEQMAVVEQFEYFYSLQHKGQTPADGYEIDGKEAVEREFAEFCRDKELQAQVAQMMSGGLSAAPEIEK